MHIHREECYIFGTRLAFQENMCLAYARQELCLGLAYSRRFMVCNLESCENRFFKENAFDLQEITRFISFLNAVRLLRITRIVRALDHYLEYGFITLVLWMLFFCLCSHWMACTFYTIADQYDNFTDVGWVKTMAEQTNQPFLLKVNASRKIESPTLASMYMSALYFSLTSLTSIGFGNVAPNTTAEKIFSCVTMIFGGEYLQLFLSSH